MNSSTIEPVKEAGHELDALIAEKVMGFELVTFSDDEAWLCVPGKNWVARETRGDRVRFTEFLPQYSTDIAPAWQVVEKIRDTTDGDETFVNLIDCGALGWLCTIEYNLTENDAAVRLGEATADTAPLAICRAALATVAGEQPQLVTCAACGMVQQPDPADARGLPTLWTGTLDAPRCVRCSEVD